MSAGEYVSVSSQRDAEEADIRMEECGLRSDPEGELLELAEIYEQRGLPPALAAEVAQTFSRGGGRRDAGGGARGRHGRRDARRPGAARRPRARLGGAPRRQATVRVLAWGAVAMTVTAGIGALVGAVI